MESYQTFTGYWYFERGITGEHSEAYLAAKGSQILRRLPSSFGKTQIYVRHTKRTP